MSARAAGRLSLVVVTWRSARTLAALVASIERHLGAEPELVVVENASGEDPEPAARAYGGELRLISLERSEGFGRACNLGVEASSREATVLINPDCELLDAGLPRLAELALRRRALTGPRLVNPDGSRQPSASGPPTGAWPWIGALVPGRLAPAPILARTEPWRLELTTEVAWLTGACIVAPRDVLLELGPFDPAIGLYAEDLDLGLRAAAAGVRSLFCPDACAVRHVGGIHVARGRRRPPARACRWKSPRRAAARRRRRRRASRLARAARQPRAAGSREARRGSRRCR